MTMSVYKSVSLYNPELKKSRAIRIRRSDFESEEALEAYCAKLRADNRAKNAEQRKNARNQLRAGVMPTAAVPTATIVIPQIEPAPAAVSSAITINGLSKKTGSTIVIYGSSKRGKSTLMMKLYKKYFKSKESINTLFSGNPQLKLYKGDTSLLISYGFGAEHAKYIQLQEYLNVATSNHYRFVEMFDDIIDQKHSDILNKLILTYRNSNISSVICLQYMCLLSKQNRASINHTFCFGMNSMEDINSILDILVGPYFTEIGVVNRAAQIHLFKEVTADHGFIYIDNIKNKMSFHRLVL
jgi:hypothetical protein